MENLFLSQGEIDEKLELFRARKIKAKEIFELREVPKSQAVDIVAKYHYLGKKGFMFTVGYGIFLKGCDEILGCATFGTVGGVSSLKGWFGIDNKQSKDFFELTRLVMHPILNGCNATSFLLGGSIKRIKKDYQNIKAIITLADNSMHCGAIYQACNFKYFGLSNKKTDFYSVDGKLNPRGKTSTMQGVWVERTRKHRYCYLIDKTLEVKYAEQPFPKGNDMNEIPKCCDGLHCVYDNRFDKWYTCPRCEGELKEISKKGALEIMKKYEE